MYNHETCTEGHEVRQEHRSDQQGVQEEERGAIRDRVQEMKAGNGEGESAVLAKIAEMREPDRTMAKRLHTIIKESAQPSRRDSGTGCPPMPRTTR